VNITVVTIKLSLDNQ